jgi:pimeloyl-ACP methyl ester carboxylesterase
VILHAAEAGAGSPVALLHGLFGSAQNLSTVQKRLAGRFRVLALDLRNHGRSRHAASMTYAAMAEDVLETLRARDALPCALVGHSMGGLIARAAGAVAAVTIARTSAAPRIGSRAMCRLSRARRCPAR